ncbi:hypothetical protein LTX14_001382 [Clostridium perfringens]|uniref:hypothetical protein n=1 Tax=Clostridium perfringens TaxID=1502 RepID=UPI001A2BC9C2|nr:hypothetical protein [Clostridium perfringens]HAT4119183.1 hypothetical protein [Clostridium perfringens]
MSRKVYTKFDDFIKSEEKNCLIVGTNCQKKHWEVLRYLNNLNKKLRILIRIPTMQNSEGILKYKAKTGVPKKVGNLSIYVDSLQVRSQENTPSDFNYIIVYPIEGLKGISDKNILDILNYRNSEKIFWVSNHDTVDFEYLKLMCDIKDTIIIDNEDKNIHDRIKAELIPKANEEFDKISVENLSYPCIENSISKRYKLGSVQSSSLPHELVGGSVDEYILIGNKKSISCIIKVPPKFEENKYILVKIIK